ncbi:MAG: sigma-54-dependent Fis family transcriptional regulator [Deltaproteobacteria bacterium]|nr:sigma-54-dependent Fis family transcriptional regulator [Deltaproteobacteria bacterium]
MARLLVVDDEPAHRDSLRRIFERAGHEVTLARDGDEALALLERVPVDVVLTDLVMPRTDGMAVLQATKQLRPQADVVLMTAYGNVENAVAAMRRGAADFLTKPTRRGELLTCVDRVLERQRLVSENRALRAELADLGAVEVGPGEVRGLARLVGASPALQVLKGTLAQVASTTAAVLFTGESGTGKELCARALHELSPRAAGPFVAVHCAALPDTLLEAELFGAEKGAFTGADERRIGRFERAHGGTLFLDEVGDIPPPMQVKLLRALQEGEVERLGGQAPVKVDVRVVAATHVDLQERVRQGRFREDLYYRLDVVSLRVPPLREREGDVALLASTFLTRHAARHGRRIEGVEPRALWALSSWSWPGNVRELSHAIERAVVLCPEGSALRFDDLPPVVRDASPGDVAAAERALHFRVGQMTLPQMERAAIDATMAFVGGDKVQAAKLLGLSLRTLYRRLDDKPGGAAADGGDDEP